MKKVIAILVFALLSITAFAADVTGKWKASVHRDDSAEPMEIVFNLKADGNRLTGTVTSPMGENPITEGTIDGDKVSFVSGNEDFKVVHKGTVTGKEMKLTVEVNDQKFEMTATKVAP